MINIPRTRLTRITPPFSCPWSLGQALAALLWLGLPFTLVLLLAPLWFVWWAALVTGLVSLGVVSWVGWQLSQAWEFRETLRHAAIRARLGRGFLDPATASLYAEKHFLSIIQRSDRIIGELDQLFADRQWINYILVHRDEGGLEVLASYLGQMQLLQAALAYDGPLAWSELQKRKLACELGELRARVMAELELEMERDRNRGRGLPPRRPPWEDAL